MQLKKQRGKYEADIGALHASTMALLQDVSDVLTLSFAPELKNCGSPFPRNFGRNSFGVLLRRVFLRIPRLLLEGFTKRGRDLHCFFSGPTSYE